MSINTTAWNVRLPVGLALIFGLAWTLLTPLGPRVFAQPFWEDDFEDGNIQDDIPVSWSPFWRVDSLEVLSGDLAMTSRSAGCARVDGLLYEDVRMHTRLRASDASFVSTGLYIYHSDDMWWGGAITGSDHSPQFDIPTNSLFIWTFDPGWRILAASPTTLNPVQTDVELRFDAIGDTLTLTGWAEGHPSQEISAQADNRLGGSIGPYINDSETPAPPTTATFRSFSVIPESWLQAGDADQDFDFDQLDLVQVQIADKYLSGEPATWGEGDWNGAPGGSPGYAPLGDGVFNQLDIVAAQQAAKYLTGSYAANSPVAVPEPSSLVLLAVGLLACGVWAQRHPDRSFGKYRQQHHGMGRGN